MPEQVPRCATCHWYSARECVNEKLGRWITVAECDEEGNWFAFFHPPSPLFGCTLHEDEETYNYDTPHA